LYDAPHIFREFDEEDAATKEDELYLGSAVLCGEGSSDNAEDQRQDYY
jgi:hypothetical protein